MEFVEFGKIARLSRECVITEKIDGTNAQVYIAPVGVFVPVEYQIAEDSDGRSMFAGSRTRYITPEADNFGFAAWVKAHADELWALGEGRHYGEWWGSGIQRGYGLPKGQKRFSLFNTGRWADSRSPIGLGLLPDDEQTVAPECCHVVPVLYRGEFSTEHIDAALTGLRVLGSVASPGFMPAEGVVVYHTASGQYFKKTIEKDAEPKSRYAGSGMTAVASLAGSDPYQGFYLLWIGIVVIGICAAYLWCVERQEQQQDWIGDQGSEPQR